MAQKTDCSLIVAAIDFGTTFSGYAYSFRHEYESDPLQIYAKNWCAGGRALISSKTPTCILFDPSGEFHSFGYEAEDKYSDLALDGDHREWYFFRCFKMKLYENWGVKRDMVLEDDKGKTMSGMKVFSSSICYLKDHMMQACGNRLVGFVESDIKWVLTVPAIWNDASKQFMREAAEQLQFHLPARGRGDGMMADNSDVPSTKEQLVDESLGEASGVNQAQSGDNPFEGENINLLPDKSRAINDFYVSDN